MEQHFALKRGKEGEHSVKLILLLLANLFTGQFKVDNSWYSQNPFPSKQSLSEPSWPTCKCKLVFSIYLSFFFFFLCSPPNQNNSQLIINIHVLWTHYIPTHQRPTHFQKARPSMHPHLAPFFNCLTQNGDFGGKVDKLAIRLCQLIACAALVTTKGCGCFFGQIWNLPCKMHWAPVIMISLSTVPPPPAESETLEGQLKKGAGEELVKRIRAT